MEELEPGVLWLRDSHLKPNLLGLHGSGDFPRWFSTSYLNGSKQIKDLEGSSRDAPFPSYDEGTGLGWSCFAQGEPKVKHHLIFKLDFCLPLGDCLSTEWEGLGPELQVMGLTSWRWGVGEEEFLQLLLREKQWMGKRMADRAGPWDSGRERLGVQEKYRQGLDWESAQKMNREIGI